MAWTAPRTWVTGELVTSTIMNAHVRDNLNYLYSTTGELVYNEFTAPVTVAATTEATATTVVTGSAYTFDGVTPVMIEFFAPRVLVSANANDIVAFALYDGSGSIGVLAQLVNVAAVSGGGPVLLRRKLTPSNASHTYSVRAYRTTANGTVNAGAGGSGAFVPGYIRIERAG